MAGASVPPSPAGQFQTWHETSEGHVCSQAWPHLPHAAKERDPMGRKEPRTSARSLSSSEANQLPLSSPNWNCLHQPAKERRKVLELYVLSLAFILPQSLICHS